MSSAGAIHTAPSRAIEGHKVVRFVFLDEGGISQHEPVAVVAGVIVHGDEQLVPLEKELHNLIAKHIPKEHQAGFVFHAKDIWSGTGRVFGDRQRWTLDRRLVILRALARIPRKLNIPIVFEAYRKENLKNESELNGSTLTAHEMSIGVHAIAFSACTLRIEEYMRAFFPSEVAQIVAEDNDQARKMIKQVHQRFRRADELPELRKTGLIPLRHIRGSVHFADKSESAPLQIADLCAFLIRGQLSGHPRNGRFYRQIRSMMIRFADKQGNYQGPTITAAPPYVATVYE